jgi:hypothetical protein
MNLYTLELLDSENGKTVLSDYELNRVIFHILIWQPREIKITHELGGRVIKAWFSDINKRNIALYEANLCSSYPDIVVYQKGAN